MDMDASLSVQGMAEERDALLGRMFHCTETPPRAVPHSAERTSVRREPFELGLSKLGRVKFQPRRQRNFYISSSTVVEARTFCTSRR